MKGLVNHIDLFSGPGGFCTGFNAAGINTVLAIEKVSSCVETYKTNHPGVFVINDDIRNVSDSDVLTAVSGVDVHLVTAGIPCETFSTAGSRSRSSYDSRQTLYREAIRIASVVNAGYLLFENVLGLLNKKTEKGGTQLVIDDIYEELVAFGFSNIEKFVLNAKDYAVPQNRERLFILASKVKDVRLFCPEPKAECYNVSDAIMDLPYLEANEKNDGVFECYEPKSKYSMLMRDDAFWKMETRVGIDYHIAPNHRMPTIKRFSLLEPGEGLKDLFDKHSKSEVEKFQKTKVLPKKWFIQRNRRLHSDRPSVTVTSHCLDELVHPYINRALSVREVARLQSFPDSYDFLGGPVICPHIHEEQDKYEQIGDAVPPMMAYFWGECLKEMIQNPEIRRDCGVQVLNSKQLDLFGLL